MIFNGSRSKSKIDQVFRIKPSEESLILARGNNSKKAKTHFKKDLEYHHLVSI